jgi:two-component sensor histidine kinase
VGDWGLNYFDKKTRTFRHFLKNVVIYVLSQDSYGTFWVGTDQGLYTTDNPSKGFRKFTGPGTDVETNNGISSAVYLICEDNKKDICVGTLSGIYKINLHSNQSTFLPIDYGIKDVANLRPYNGWGEMQREMYVGDESGYYVFFPGELTTNPTPPLIIFSGFRAGGKSVTPAEGKLLSSSLDLLKRITVKHNQNSFSFDFECIHYSNPGRNRVFYKLDNYDEDWLNPGAARTAYYYNVPPGTYVFHVKAASGDGVWAERRIELIVLSPWWSRWWAYVMYVLVMIVGVWVVVHYRSRSLRTELEQRKKDQQLAEMKQKTAELQHRAIELEMKALRSQMNPHFVFNSLNSINRFILQNNRGQASEYLTKFSRLVRIILSSSSNVSVSLAEDLEALQLYLELESLRFEKKFCYKIECDPEIDTDFVQVPPMLLQPFVENAIWHGLMNKEGEGHLWININQENSTLLCTITDDGIGRKKAAELEDKSGKHKSMGMKITESRIAMMREMNGESKSVEIKDLVDSDGSAAGTEVVLRIPVKQEV